MVPGAAVKNDHQSTMRIKTFRGPNTSPHQLLGSSKSEYARTKAMKAYFRSASLRRPNSLITCDWAEEKLTRSRYVIIESAASNASKT